MSHDSHEMSLVPSVLVLKLKLFLGMTVEESVDLTRARMALLSEEIPLKVPYFEWQPEAAQLPVPPLCTIDLISFSNVSDESHVDDEPPVSVVVSLSSPQPMNVRHVQISISFFIFTSSKVFALGYQIQSQPV